MLTHWVRPTERHQGKLALERAVHLLSGRNAAYLGLADRGRIAPGLRADINLIDPVRLGVGTPHLVRDMPAGGKRFLQKGQGYVAPGWPGAACSAMAWSPSALANGAPGAHWAPEASKDRHAIPPPGQEPASWCRACAWAR
jgi:hypothetical protein